ncbi:hypothetical protein Taro_001203 [Colocasia esculenta]|uniref:Uncharacterized protein n=1 Tax=Colocasia esculenta TaxID=4460 RepID=A0A843T9C0_COLES|nr:hypothetical protein [Colocasia esculenta]
MAFLYVKNAPLPLWIACLAFWGDLWKRWFRNPPSTKDATYRGVAMMSRPARPPRHRRGAQHLC